MQSLSPGLIGWFGEVSGVALVVSADEKRILFLPKDMSHLRWILVEEFVVDPVTIAGGDDIKKLRGKAGI